MNKTQKQGDLQALIDAPKSNEIATRIISLELAISVPTPDKSIREVANNFYNYITKGQVNDVE